MQRGTEHPCSLKHADAPALSIPLHSSYEGGKGFMSLLYPPSCYLGLWYELSAYKALISEL